jgi:hypothetical protein
MGGEGKRNQNRTLQSVGWKEATLLGPLTLNVGRRWRACRPAATAPPPHPECLLAVEPQRDLGGVISALVEGRERGVPEPLAVEEHERLDGVLVEVDALVGVADGDVDGEVVGERGARGEGEARERGRVGGGDDHVRV